MSEDDLFERYYQAALNDIYVIDETYSTIFNISDNRKAINASIFGHLFGRIQKNFQELMFVAVGRLFDPRRDVLSIPAMLRKASDFKLDNKDTFIESLRKIGVPEEAVATVAAEGLSQRASAALSAHFPTRSTFPALDRVITMRHKEIAHRDDSAEKFERPAFVDVKACNEVAKNWLSCFAIGIRNTALRDDRGNFFISDDAEGTSHAIKRILEATFVIPPENRHMLEYLATTNTARFNKIKKHFIDQE